jgi:hypothetical protein
MIVIMSGCFDCNLWGDVNPAGQGQPRYRVENHFMHFHHKNSGGICPCLTDFMHFQRQTFGGGSICLNRRPGGAVWRCISPRQNTPKIQILRRKKASILSHILTPPTDSSVARISTSHPQPQLVARFLQQPTFGVNDLCLFWRAHL